MTRHWRPNIIAALLIAGQLLLASVTFSQNPTQIIAVATKDEDTQISDIFTIQLNGENRTNLTQHPADDIWPAWSPDGERIAFSSDRGGTYDIWLMNADGSDPTNLTNSTRQEYVATWSPDGSRIMFQGKNGGKEFPNRYRDLNLYVIRLDDGEITQLTNDRFELRGYGGSWSPDGTRIMLAAALNTGETDPDVELYMLYLDEPLRRIQVSNDVFFGASPFWTAEYEIVLFSTKSRDRPDDAKGYYKINPVTGEKEFLIYPFSIYTAVGLESDVAVMLFDGLDGICYFNTETGDQFFIDNTGPFDDSMSWKPTDPELAPESEAPHRFRRGQC